MREYQGIMDIATIPDIRIIKVYKLLGRVKQIHVS
jgi:hypothetical protein